MKILLAHPAVNPAVSFQDFMLAPPLAFEILAATLKDHDVRVADLRCNVDLREEVESFEPDIVGVTCLTQEVYAALEVLKTVKAIDARMLTVVGGIHASLVPEDLQKEFVDVIVVGEGEITFREVVRFHESGKGFSSVPGIIYRSENTWNRNGPRDPITDIDTIPLADRTVTRQYSDHYFSMTEKPVAAVLTGRGCPYSCNFCSVWKLFSKRCLQMSAERIVKELAHIEQDYIVVCDDNFIQNPRDSAKLYDMILAEGIRKRYFVQARSDTIARNPSLIEKWKEIGLMKYWWDLNPFGIVNLQVWGKEALLNTTTRQ